MNTILPKKFGFHLGERTHPHNEDTRFVKSEETRKKLASIGENVLLHLKKIFGKWGDIMVNEIRETPEIFDGGEVYSLPENVRRSIEEANAQHMEPKIKPIKKWK